MTLKEWTEEWIEVYVKPTAVQTPQNVIRT